MKGKLIKDGEHYFLFEGDRFISTTDCSEGTLNKLSLKNCQAIERGYDLDELVDESFDDNGFHSTVTPYEESQFKRGYILAFQKALEILGDKKFSEEDISKAIAKGIQIGSSSCRWGLEGHDYIQSLQQTEWDVIVEMECVIGCQNLILNGENSVCCGDKKPKISEDGCLILKRIDDE